jgi:hypothetical protein
MNTIKELLILHHTHTDLGYTHPQPVIWELHDRYLDEAIDLCEQTSDWPEACRMKWTCEVTCTFLHWLDRAPETQIGRLHALVRHGQISFGAMWAHWMLPLPRDLFIESLQPVRRIREQFGAPVSVAIQHDVNGIPWSAVDILNDAGIAHLLMGINIHMGGFPMRRPMAFHWAGPSGRTLLAFSGEHYNTFSREAGLRAAAADLDRAEQGLNKYFGLLARKGWEHDFAFLTATHPFMDDNGPPNPELPGIIRRWNEEGRAPFIRLVTPEQLFEKLHTLPESALPVHRGDWTDFWSSGSGSLALETQMMRRAKNAWSGARSLAARSGVALNPVIEREALRQIFVAYEHTVTAFCSTAAFGPSRKLEPLPVAEQWNQKAACAASALSLARMLRRDALDAAAKNPAQARRCGALLVFNPSDAPQRVVLRVAKELLAGDYPLIAGTKHRFDVWEDLWRAGGADWAGPVELAAKELKHLALETLPRAKVAAGVAAKPDAITSPHFVLEFDPATGRMRSLKPLVKSGVPGRELVNPASPWELFGPVRETVATPSVEARAAGDLRYDLFQVTEAIYQRVHDDEILWNRHWPARHDKPEQVLRVETHVDAEGAHLVRVFRMAGVNGELEQSITLLAHEPRVRFEAYFNKADVLEPESLYFTFPFQMPGAQSHYDTGGGLVAFDREQLPGACRDWVAAETGVTVAGDDGCLVLASPDAPLFQIGGFNYARGNQTAAGLDQSVLVAWPMNNYWNTNFRASQPGFIRLSYELGWFDKFEARVCREFGESCACPPVWHPVAEASTAIPD